jgi:hypothetical protein
MGSESSSSSSSAVVRSSKGPAASTQLDYECWVATALERGPERNTSLELTALELNPRPDQTVGPLLEPGLASPETMLAAEPTDA